MLPYLYKKKKNRAMIKKPKKKKKRKKKKGYLALWDFIKLGPCLRNSVVSPKKGHPIVPGGNPFLLYRTSFHRSKAEQKQRSKNRARIAKANAIEAPKKLEMGARRKRER